jgi:hypothetical protein
MDYEQLDTMLMEHDVPQSLTRMVYEYYRPILKLVGNGDLLKDIIKPTAGDCTTDLDLNVKTDKIEIRYTGQSCDLMEMLIPIFHSITLPSSRFATFDVAHSSSSVLLTSLSVNSRVFIAELVDGPLKDATFSIIWWDKQSIPLFTINFSIGKIAFVMPVKKTCSHCNSTVQQFE